MRLSVSETRVERGRSTGDCVRHKDTESPRRRERETQTGPERSPETVRRLVVSRLIQSFPPAVVCCACHMVRAPPPPPGPTTTFRTHPDLWRCNIRATAVHGAMGLWRCEAQAVRDGQAEAGPAGADPLDTSAHRTPRTGLSASDAGAPVLCRSHQCATNMPRREAPRCHLREVSRRGVAHRGRLCGAGAPLRARNSPCSWTPSTAAGRPPSSGSHRRRA